MKHFTLLQLLFKSPTGARVGSGRWVYLAASLGPASVIAAGLFNRSSYDSGVWLLVAMLVACVLQFLRPCLVGALAIGGFHALVAVGLIARQIEAFQAYGGGDHGAWEGWQTERFFLALTVFVTVVAMGVAVNAWSLMKSSR